MKYNIKLITSILLIVTLSSCSTKKHILYMQDIEDFDGKEFYNPPQSKIQPNDLLKIDISTPNYTSPTGDLGESRGGEFFNRQALFLEGYLVSPDYKIKHKFFGELDVKDKTIFELEEDIEQILLEQDKLKGPIVKVRVLNAKYTIHGDVRSPGTYTMSEPRLNILQAIGYAGDLTLNGVRDDIMIVRQENGKQIVGTIDLTSAALTQSPFFFIKQNDYIYVRPNSPKVKQAGFVGSLGTTLSVISVALSTYLIVRANFFN